MTQQELISLILQLKCCSATLGYNLSVNLINGGTNCENHRLLILNDSIEVLLKYSITDKNCLTIDEFEKIKDNAKQLCKICSCE